MSDTPPKDYTEITPRAAARRNLVRDAWTFVLKGKVCFRNDDARVYWSS